MWCRGVWSVLPLMTLLGLAQASSTELTLNDGNVLPLEVYEATGHDLVLWLPTDSGIKIEDHQQAQRLAAMGHEVWLVDLFSAFFLPLGASSLDGIGAEPIVELIQKASATGKSVILIAPERAAIVALRGINAIQRSEPDMDVRLLMLHPKLYEANPKPGTTAQLMPEVEVADVTTLILQPQQSPWYWRLHEIRAALQVNGSEVYTWHWTGVRDRFWFRPDANNDEHAAASQLAQRLHQAIRLLLALPPRAHYPATTTRLVDSAGREEKLLQPYTGNAVPPTLKLPRLRGGMEDLAQYHGKVVVVNFWASWCPPCVHEMPSMEALYREFRDKGLEMLAVNMAEDPAIIMAFLQEKVSVSFKILLDADGNALQRWKVFAFPTSYIVDRQGRIRYAVYGAIDWQSEDTQNKIRQLLQE